jgi:RNA polymerase sigma-70 factor (ECF subfamily)
LTFSDETLIEEIRGGSRIAFDQLMQRYQQLVFRTAYSYCRQPEDALDISQDVFIKVYRKLGSYAGRGAFRSWLLRIAHNESVNWVRKHRRQRDIEELTPANTPGYAATQERDLLKRERGELLLGELGELNPRQRAAMTLRYFEEMSIREIAEVLECSQGVVKSILFRGLERLRHRLVLQRR